MHVQQGLLREEGEAVSAWELRAPCYGQTLAGVEDKIQLPLCSCPWKALGQGIPATSSSYCSGLLGHFCSLQSRVPMILQDRVGEKQPYFRGEKRETSFFPGLRGPCTQKHSKYAFSSFLQF